MVSCEAYLAWWQTVLVIVASILSIGLAAVFALWAGFGVIEWGMHKLRLFPEDDQNPPTPPLTYTQKALSQAWKQRKEAWTLKVGEGLVDTREIDDE